MAGTEARQRLFFALWPPAGMTERIAALAHSRDMPGRPVTRDKLHVTLAFHGACDPARRAALMARAERVTAAPMRLVFDRLDRFAKPRVIWLGLSQPPAALFELAGFLRDSTLDRQAFLPHITLCRKAESVPARPIAPLAWTAREFVLVESGVRGAPGTYRTIGRWPLGSAGQGNVNVK